MISGFPRKPQTASDAKTAASVYKEHLGFIRSGVVSGDDIQTIKQLNVHLLDAVADSKFKLRHNELKTHLEKTLAALERLEGLSCPKNLSSPALSRAQGDCRNRRSPQPPRTPRIGREPRRGSPLAHLGCYERRPSRISVPLPPQCPRGPPIFAPVRSQATPVENSLRGSPEGSSVHPSPPKSTAVQFSHCLPLVAPHGSDPALSDDTHHHSHLHCSRPCSPLCREGANLVQHLRGGCALSAEDAAAAYEKCQQLKLELNRAQEERSNLYLQLSAARRENDHIRALYEAKVQEVHWQREMHGLGDLSELERMLLHAETLMEHINQVRTHSHTWSVWSGELLQYLRSLHARHVGRCGEENWDLRPQNEEGFVAGCRTLPRGPPISYSTCEGLVQLCPRRKNATPCCPPHSPRSGAGFSSGTESPLRHCSSALEGTQTEDRMSHSAHLRSRASPSDSQRRTNRPTSPCCSVTLDAAQVEAVRTRAGCTGPIIRVHDVQPQQRETDCEGPRRRVLRDPQIFDYVT